jgi:hypothetical protein
VAPTPIIVSENAPSVRCKRCASKGASGCANSSSNTGFVLSKRDKKDALVEADLGVVIVWICDFKIDETAIQRIKIESRRTRRSAKILAMCAVCAVVKQFELSNYHAKSEFLPNLREVRRSVQTKLHAIVLEPIIGLSVVLCRGFSVQHIVTTDRQLGVFVERISDA